jgi:hypothetical protein
MNEFKMKDSLIFGKKGEEQILQKHSDELTMDGATGRHGDDTFRIETGGKVEIKTEDYKYSPIFDMRTKQSPNAAIEEISVIKRNTPGGPWKAALDGCEFYVHYFPKNDGLALIFRPKEFCEELEVYIKKCNPKLFFTQSGKLKGIVSP